MDVLELLNELWQFLHPDNNLILAIDPIVGGAIITGVGSVLNGLFGKKSQSDANATNLQIARETNENQYKMFKEGNDFNERMANLAWNRETSYNDPKAILERYQRAGINGQVAMSGSLGSAATQPADMSAPQSLAPPMLHAPTVEPLPNALSAITDVAQVVGTLYNAKKADADATRTLGLYEQELQNMVEEGNYKKLLNTYQTIQNDILAKTGLDKAFGEIREQNSKILLNDKMTVTEKMKQFDLLESGFLKRAERKLSGEKYRQLVESWPLLKKQLQAQIALVEEQKRTEQSKQNANNAAAEDSRAGAEDKRQSAAGKKIDNFYKPAQNESEIDARDAHSQVEVYDSETRRGEAKGKSYGNYNKVMSYPDDGEDWQKVSKFKTKKRRYPRKR